MNKTFNELANQSIYIETTCLNPLSDKQGICSFKNKNGYCIPNIYKMLYYVFWAYQGFLYRVAIYQGKEAFYT